MPVSCKFPYNRWWHYNENGEARTIGRSNDQTTEPSIHHPFAGLILAAGKGTRFRGEPGKAFSKVLRPLLGRPLVLYVVETLTNAGIDEIVVLVGFGSDEVRRAVGDRAQYVVQDEQKGSGHAVACAREHYAGFNGGLLVMCGDSPLFGADTVREMMRRHVETGAAVTLASAVLDDPFGYGRILREPSGRIVGIVEEKCATDEQRAITEVNGGAYAFDSRWLFDNIDQMSVNEAGEHNLTDMVRVAVDQGRVVSAVECGATELLGVNTPEQLAAVEQILMGK